jgi:hypothetical protein
MISKSIVDVNVYKVAKDEPGMGLNTVLAKPRNTATARKEAIRAMEITSANCWDLGSSPCHHLAITAAHTRAGAKKITGMAMVSAVIPSMPPMIATPSY